MDFPLDKILEFDKNKYEATVGMISYLHAIEETPEILLEYSEKDRSRRVAIIINDILSGKIKYKEGEK